MREINLNFGKGFGILIFDRICFPALSGFLFPALFGFYLVSLLHLSSILDCAYSVLLLVSDLYSSCS